MFSLPRKLRIDFCQFIWIRSIVYPFFQSLCIENNNASQSGGKSSLSRLHKCTVIFPTKLHALSDHTKTWMISSKVERPIGHDSPTDFHAFEPIFAGNTANCQVPTRNLPIDIVVQSQEQHRHLSTHFTDLVEGITPTRSLAANEIQRDNR